MFLAGNSFTVFVPSNDALQKVPDSDLEMIRRNMTALRGKLSLVQTRQLVID